MFNIEIDLIEDEKIESTHNANHFMGFEAVGGKLFITNKRFVFKSHSINIQNHELTIQYSDIERIELCFTFLIVPNGLKIITKSGKKDQFVVWKRKMIKEAIEQKMKELNK